MRDAVDLAAAGHDIAEPDVQDAVRDPGRGLLRGGGAGRQDRERDGQGRKSGAPRNARDQAAQEHAGVELGDGEEHGQPVEIRPEVDFLAPLEGRGFHVLRQVHGGGVGQGGAEV